MYENQEENGQIIAKCLPFFKISPIYAWKKITPFSWFREFAPTFDVVCWFSSIYFILSLSSLST